ncbi:hypothetical protein UFOVP1288_17 [uncultured Caudovirales phage]|uniref:Uncharacterized protein n=1 Tax=uncultured Caudovirales phage TaxID=2100421 RepID=A0A6J5RU58_9CAUD|nr:hypothetical protein UFOVP1195_17 [uncultured Caudovirales phage]CAB4195464.1 hypothetical protein UFOVP1288_17 [uncultured Caudovirales phage]CAB4204918.1 hypothetical protein UFOVP1409_17 [uncultured Caudovirales phage]
MSAIRFERSPEGLRDALLSEMEDLRAGIATPAEAQAFAVLAKTIVSSMEAEIAERVRRDVKAERDRQFIERRDRLNRYDQETLVIEHDDGT